MNAMITSRKVDVMAPMLDVTIRHGEVPMALKRLDPIPPGEILWEEYMRPLEVSINRLGRDIAVPPNRISGIVNGKRAITADTALRLAKYFGTSAELWLGLQSDYDLRMVRRTAGATIDAQVRVRAA